LAVTLADILVIAPYNAQVFELQKRLGGARIGTVDKFQGQAPLVIYSMTTSSHAELEGLDQRRDAGPVLGANVMAGEQCVLAIE
jgi:superfamily I DNA and/or RNA helicase